MTRWNIERIVLYSHDEQKEEIEFELKDVNIITGDSHTGKSAIVEIIDYVMGAQECHIPGYVRNCLSWVGIVWVKADTKVVLYRKIPSPNRKSNSTMHFDIGTNVKVAQSSNVIPHSTNVEGALKSFENLLGMGDVKGEAFGANRDTGRISIRSAMPYMLLDDDVIISKISLLRGLNDDRKQTIVDSIPYFVGAVDESTLNSEIMLRSLEKQLVRLEKSLANSQLLKGEGNTRAKALLDEAIQLGMCEETDKEINESEIYSRLESLLKWNVHEATQGEERLSELYGDLRVEQEGLLEARNHLRRAKKAISQASEFESTVTNQGHRLKVINLFRSPETAHYCPLCSHELTDMNSNVEYIVNAVKRVQTDLRRIETQRPRLDEHISKLEGKITEHETKIRDLTDRIETLVKQSEQVERGLDPQARQLRTVGRISLYLETIERLGEPKSDNKITLLRSEISDLESEVDLDAKQEAIENAQKQIEAAATDILKNLPFEERYDNRPIYFSLRNVKAGISLPSRIEEMRDLGSDENYLSIHLAILLGLHRHFKHLDRPVPGVLVIDQISRPYFPPDKEKNEVEIENDTDRVSLLSYFNFLFDEVDEQDSLQIIILEHAYFANNERYVKSTLRRWKRNEKGLIPQTWREIT